MYWNAEKNEYFIQYPLPTFTHNHDIICFTATTSDINSHVRTLPESVFCSSACHIFNETWSITSAMEITNESLWFYT